MNATTATLNAQRQPLVDGSPRQAVGTMLALLATPIIADDEIALARECPIPQVAHRVNQMDRRVQLAALAKDLRLEQSGVVPHIATALANGKMDLASPAWRQEVADQVARQREVAAMHATVQAAHDALPRNDHRDLRRLMVNFASSWLEEVSDDWSNLGRAVLALKILCEERSLNVFVTTWEALPSSVATTWPGLDRARDLIWSHAPRR